MLKPIEKTKYTPSQPHELTHGISFIIGTSMNGMTFLLLKSILSNPPFLDEKNNGLTALTHCLRGKVPEFAYVILDKGERSREADIFADYL